MNTRGSACCSGGGGPAHQSPAQLSPPSALGGRGIQQGRALYISLSPRVRLTAVPSKSPPPPRANLYGLRAYASCCVVTFQHPGLGTAAQVVVMRSASVEVWKGQRKKGREGTGAGGGARAWEHARRASDIPSASAGHGSRSALSVLSVTRGGGSDGPLCARRGSARRPWGSRQRRRERRT